MRYSCSQSNFYKGQDSEKPSHKSEGPLTSNFIQLFKTSPVDCPKMKQDAADCFKDCLMQPSEIFAVSSHSSNFVFYRTRTTPGHQLHRQDPATKSLAVVLVSLQLQEEIGARMQWLFSKSFQAMMANSHLEVECHTHCKCRLSSQ